MDCVDKELESRHEPVWSYVSRPDQDINKK